MQKNRSELIFIIALVYSIAMIIFSSNFSSSKTILVGLWFLPIIICIFFLKIKETLTFSLLFMQGINIISNEMISQFTIFIPFFIILLINDNNNVFKIRKHFLIFPFLLYLFSYIVTFLYAREKTLSYNWHIIGFQFYIIYLFLSNYLENKSHLIKSIIVFLMSFIIPLFYGFIQFYEGTSRIKCNVSNPNENAGYMAFYFFLSSAIFFSFKNKILRVSSLVICILSFFMLIATSSRGGQLAVFAGIILVAFIKLRAIERKKILPVVISISITVGLIITFLGSKYLSRFSEISTENLDFSTIDRLGLWYSAFRLFLESPIVGIGVNNFQDFYREFHPLYGIIPIDKMFVAHNIFLNTLAEQGLIGIVALAALHFAVGKKLYWMLKNIKLGVYREITIALSAFFVYILIHNSLDTYWTSYAHNISHFVLAFYFALITSVDRLYRWDIEKYNNNN